MESVPVRVSAWFLLVAGLLAIAPTIRADEWQDMLTDFELFEEQMQFDSSEITTELERATLDGSDDLFPVPEGATDAAPDYSLSDTHVTIKVDGVPIVLNDVPIGEWFAPYIRDAADRKIISGYRNAEGRPSGLFGPADSVTIEQLAKMAVLTAQIDPYDCGESFRNIGAKGLWSERYIRCAEYVGWAVYSDGSVDVLRPATRSEVVVTVLQALKQRISPRSGTVFDDVTTATAYGAAVETAAAVGIVSGYADAAGNPTGFFGPDDPVNRAETAKIFSLAFQVYAGD